MELWPCRLPVRDLLFLDHIMEPKHPIDYQYVLRAIGQGLENLEVNSFELEFSDGQYFVSGNCTKTKTAVQPQPGLAKAFLRLVRSVDKKTRKRDVPFHFSGLRFGPTDVEMLDRRGKALRSSWEGSSKDLYSISQVLRMTGAYLDHLEGSLLRLSWEQPILKLWYANKRGLEIKDQFRPADLYEVWVRQFKKRKPNLKPTGSD
jgi:hypothetical protein